MNDFVRRMLLMGGNKKMKMATGTYTMAAGNKTQKTVSITGLGFRPVAIGMASAYPYVSTSEYLLGTSVWGICGTDGEPVAYQALTAGGRQLVGSQNFVPNDDGFSVVVYDYTEAYKYVWWAIGK